jgi:hypothetical protein
MDPQNAESSPEGSPPKVIISSPASSQSASSISPCVELLRSLPRRPLPALLANVSIDELLDRTQEPVQHINHLSYDRASPIRSPLHAYSRVTLDFFGIGFSFSTMFADSGCDYGVALPAALHERLCTHVALCSPTSIVAAAAGTRPGHLLVCYLEIPGVSLKTITTCGPSTCE